MMRARGPSAGVTSAMQRANAWPWGVSEIAERKTIEIERRFHAAARPPRQADGPSPASKGPSLKRQDRVRSKRGRAVRAVGFAIVNATSGNHPQKDLLIEETRPADGSNHQDEHEESSRSKIGEKEI